jgi:hypothetical protein
MCNEKDARVDSKTTKKRTRIEDIRRGCTRWSRYVHKHLTRESLFLLLVVTRSFAATVACRDTRLR